MLRLFGRGGLLVVALGLVLSCAAPDSTAPSAGNPPPPANTRLWSDAATWPGHQLPQAGDSVVIPAGVTIKLDTDPPAAAQPHDRGHAVLRGPGHHADHRLDTGGRHPPSRHRRRAYRNRAVITLTGSPGNADIRGSREQDDRSDRHSRPAWRGTGWMDPAQRQRRGRCDRHRPQEIDGLAGGRPDRHRILRLRSGPGRRSGDLRCLRQSTSPCRSRCGMRISASCSPWPDRPWTSAPR